MLAELSIRNYALIDDISVSFTDGFTTITGETGAGKSILLGGLSLVLGKRADLSSLREADKKCVIEAEFDIEAYELQDFYADKDLIYEPRTIIRREIHPGGKSRAFINDSPTTLDLLTQLSKRLVDIHSQHQTLQLTEEEFQLHVIDALANNGPLLEEYLNHMAQYRSVKKELEDLMELQQNAIKDHDYNSFLLNELESAKLEAGMLQQLEEEYQQLNNAETILESLSAGDQVLNDEQMGLVAQLFQLKQITARLSGFGAAFQKLHDRLESVRIEIDDIGSDIAHLREGVEANPQLLEEVNNRLQQVYDLQKKHGVVEIHELLEIKEELAVKVDKIENLDAEIAASEEKVAEALQSLTQIAAKLHHNRNAVVPSLKDKLERRLWDLGMPNASFEIRIVPGEDFRSNGTDKLIFLFSANKGSDYGVLKKVASGGEMSRIMLVIKSILASYEKLPTLMFDEIDSGVSGDISNAMGDIMQEMSENMQVFSITHLPQVASKGRQHYKVYKEDIDSKTHTRIKKLNQEERVVELAEMLGGKSITDSAMAHAKQLLN